MQIKESIKEELKSYKNENIRYYVDCYACDLHHELFNSDYYIIGYHRAKLWLKYHDISAWDAIRIVQEYEKDEFGEVTTDCSSSENVVNMLAYIYGFEILLKSRTLDKLWNKRLSINNINDIIDDIC